jgi:hypothetical protein
MQSILLQLPALEQEADLGTTSAKVGQGPVH